MSQPHVQFQVSKVTNAAPNHPKFVKELQEAVSGGEATHAFFSGDMSTLQAVAARTAKDGDAAWTNVDEAGSLGYDFLDPSLPASYVKAGGGTMIMQLHMSHDALGQDSTDYKEAGIATAYLVTDAGPVDVIVSYVEKLGPAVAGVALTPVIAAVFKAVKTWVQQFISKAFSAAEEGGEAAEEVASEAAEGAAEEAAVDGEIIADELALSVAFGPAAIVGLAIAAITLVVTAILFFLSKTMTCFLRVYNFTNQEVTLNLCKTYDLETKQEPKTGTLPPVGIPPAPPGVKALDKVIYRADYVFLNKNELKGVGAVIQAPGSPAHPNEFPGLSLLFDVPSVGDNSIYIRLDGTPDCGQLWDGLSGTYKRLSMSTCQGQFHAYMGTNQLRGKSSSPLTGDEGYFYEFMIVIEEEDLFFPN